MCPVSWVLGLGSEPYFLSNRTRAQAKRDEGAPDEDAEARRAAKERARAARREGEADEEEARRRERRSATAERSGRT